jgi:hypothetical protein
MLSAAICVVTVGRFWPSYAIVFVDTINVISGRLGGGELL